MFKLDHLKKSNKRCVLDTNNVKKIGIVGAGLMGHGIALQFALKGYDVMLNDLEEGQLEQARSSISINLKILQDLDMANDQDITSVPNRIHTSTSLEESMAEVDFVIEAVFEDLPLKLRVFEELDRHCPQRTILTSNTSSFMTSQLVPATNRPDKVLVANWWNPPYLLPLIEVVKGPDTSDNSLKLTTDLFTNIGKTPVVLQKESLGFIGNRMQFALLREALSIVSDGIATPEDIDKVVTNSFGRRLSVAGPLEVFDVAGWDTIIHIVDQLFPNIESSGKTPKILTDLVQKGNYGVKSGQGFYQWDEESVKKLRERIGETLATLDKLT